MASIENKWTKRSEDGIFPQLSFAAGVYNDRYLIIIGESEDYFGVLSVTMFDTKTRSQISLPRIPNTESCDGIVLNEYFYLFYSKDDDDEDGGDESEVYRLSLSTHTKWEKLNPMKNRNIYYSDMVSDVKHLYLLTVQYDTLQARYARMDRYDPMLEKFTNISGFASFERADATAVVGNQIFFFGERSDSLAIFTSSTVRVFDTSLQSFRTVPQLPTPLDDIKTLSFGRWIIAIGNMPTLSDQVVFVFDTTKQQWSKIENALPIHTEGFLVIGCHIVWIGSTGAIESVHIKHLIPSWRWDVIKDFILLRKLINDGRAHILRRSKRVRNGIDRDTTKAKQVMEKLLTDTSLDIFRNVLTYLLCTDKLDNEIKDP